ncbi:MAG: GNAT family N-acetyltransferase [Rhodobacteraceae bacterium]|nr:GNAT family N-acetyltransferase [Paracoccaceae bacterium]
MSVVPVIETPRLILREHRLTDFDPIAKHWESDRTQWTGGPHDRRRAWEVFSMDAAQWHLRGYGMWIVEERESGATAGWIGFYEPDHYDETEIGWVLLEAFEGKGYGFEAAMAARTYGEEHFGITAPCSFIATPNTRSVALAERMGATLEDTRTGPKGPFFVYRHPTPEAHT